MRRFISVFILIGLVAISLSAQEKQPKVIKYKAPIYSPAARATKTQGIVIVSAKLNRNGEVTESKAISGHPLLKASAELAAKQWIFSIKDNSARTLQVQIKYSIKENKKSKNNYKDSNYKVKFTKPYTLEIIETQYPRINY